MKGRQLMLGITASLLFSGSGFAEEEVTCPCWAENGPEKITIMGHIAQALAGVTVKYDTFFCTVEAEKAAELEPATQGITLRSVVGNANKEAGHYTSYRLGEVDSGGTTPFCEIQRGAAQQFISSEEPRFLDLPQVVYRDSLKDAEYQACFALLRDAIFDAEEKLGGQGLCSRLCTSEKAGDYDGNPDCEWPLPTP